MEKILLEEQEVSINFDRLDETATIYTSDITWIKKMDKMCKECPDEYKCIEESICGDVVVGKTYSFPKKLISLRKPMKQKNISEKVKALRKENLSKSKSKNKKD